MQNHTPKTESLLLKKQINYFYFSERFFVVLFQFSNEMFLIYFYSCFIQVFDFPDFLEKSKTNLASPFFAQHQQRTAVATQNQHLKED